MAVYPGTFDPFTSGHRDLVARARVMFDRVIVSLAVNANKRPTAEAETRAVLVGDAMPAAWGNVEVDTWTGLTTAYCLRRGATVIVRGVRTAENLRYDDERTTRHSDGLVAVPSAACRHFVHGRTRIPLGTVGPSVASRCRVTPSSSGTAATLSGRFGHLRVRHMVHSAMSGPGSNKRKGGPR
nr:adenylyltransferase/cytidyltransferase family protein [Micromonospora tarapacensis]